MDLLAFIMLRAMRRCLGLLLALFLGLSSLPCLCFAFSLPLLCLSFAFDLPLLGCAFISEPCFHLLEQRWLKQGSYLALPDLALLCLAC